MGVAGLTPFLKKVCPQVIKTLPHRLQGLEGTTLAIDGTLITHRLHFAHHPHENRHVLGWYRLIEELRERSVKAICIFDGHQRMAAKAPETARRSLIRTIAKSRASVETERAARLSALKVILKQIKRLQPADRMLLFSRLQKEYNVSEEGSLTEESTGRIKDLIRSFSDSPAMSPADNVTALTTQDINKIFQSLKDLFRQQHQSNRKPLPATDVPTQPEASMSKAQAKLVQAEEKVWTTIADASTDIATAVEAVSTLENESRSMSDTYTRQTSQPSKKNYAECKELLEALGVPCLTVRGFYEAEAVAASLVLGGLADYVASEDTDVLIYEAPMIRNISNRQGPLTLISGAEVRSELGLGRDSFVDFALLLGTDFSQRISNVGPHRAYHLIQKHGSIEHILMNQAKYKLQSPIEEYMRQVNSARGVFRHLPPTLDPKKLRQKESDDSKVADILERCGLGSATMGRFDYSDALKGNYFVEGPNYLAGIDIDC